MNIQREPIRKNQFGTKILGGADGTYEEGMIQQEPIRKAGLRRKFSESGSVTFTCKERRTQKGGANEG